jgi:O-antigen/teichoic acid export membrane protein
MSGALAQARKILTDPLYRGTLVLLVNTGLVAGLGFAFWTLAARYYPASAVGAFSGLSSGVGIVGAVASLGLPNFVTRHLGNVENSRGLLIVVTGAIVVLGGVISAIIVFGLGSFFPASLHLSAHGGDAFLFLTLVIVSSLNNVYTAGLVKLRATRSVLWTSLVGAVAKLAAVVALASFASLGIVLSFSIGLALSTILSVPPLIGKARGGSELDESLKLFQKHSKVTFSNYVATIFGMLPSTVVPLEVVGERGAAAAAPFALAFLVSGFLNIIPSTASGVMFAEASRDGASMRQQATKATRAIFGLLTPATAVAVLAAPYIMRTFGANYAAEGASTLRILCLSTLVMSGNYIIDSLLISKDRSSAYLFMNGANSALVLGFVGLLLHHGVIGGAEGWALGQSASLVLGLLVMALQSMRKSADLSLESAELESQPREAKATAQPDLQGTDVRQSKAHEDLARAFRVLESMASNESLMQGLSPWHTQPIPMVKVSSSDSEVPEDLARAFQVLESMASNDHPSQRLSLQPKGPVGAVGPARQLTSPGQVVFVGLWFPLLRVSLGDGQGGETRKLPVLVAFSGNTGWMYTQLIASLDEQNVLDACWKALMEIGGMPRYLVWDGAYLRESYARFLAPFGTQTRPANASHLAVIQSVYASLESELIDGKEVLFPYALEERLKSWVKARNAYLCDPRQESMIALVAADRRALMPLPDRPADVPRFLDGRPGV